LKNKIIPAIALVALVAAITTLGQGQQSAYADSVGTKHYKIGYSDGCTGAVVPGHHTSEYLSGYADGSKACHNTQVSEHNSVVSPSQNTANANNNDKTDGHH
jgi:hypothetical protein